MLRQEDSQQ
jgi:hypothetical protein